MKRFSKLISFVLLGAVFLSACPEEEKPKTDSGPVACTPGTDGCACNDGACNDGLTCQDNVCHPTLASSGLQVLSADARSCNFLLSPVSKDTKVVFAATVKGQSLREGDKLAVSFLSKDNESFGQDALSVEGAPADMQVSRAKCFDGQGAAIAGDGVSLQP